MPVTAAPMAPVAGTFTVCDLRRSLVTYGEPLNEVVRETFKLLKSTFDLLKAVADNKPMTGVSAIPSSLNSATKTLLVSKALETGMQATSFALFELKHRRGQRFRGC